jgi:hypothetical protein
VIVTPDDFAVDPADDPEPGCASGFDELAHPDINTATAMPTTTIDPRRTNDFTVLLLRQKLRAT